MGIFELESPFEPTGDQPQAIEKLTQGLRSRCPYQTLLGVTGSGKTFSLACTIARIERPVLVISHNKTLAAQLYAEFKEFFPSNSVEYFVSYYDYYQPESYIPQTDTYIEKDASINERLDRLRLSTTSSLACRRDVIVVSSVSCIYNLGSPQDYQNLVLFIEKGQTITQEELIRKFLQMQYERNDFDFSRGTFRVKGDTVDIFPAYEEQAFKILFSADTVEKMYEFNAITGERTAEPTRTALYPAKHFIMEKGKIDAALAGIIQEMEERTDYFRREGKIVEAQRLRAKTLFDVEMLKEIGYCHGIENYSRHLSGRAHGSRPYCLIDYFPDDFITVIDESHVTIPQLKGMYAGDRSRKETLVKYGFRLPSCLDNRPLTFDEFMELTGDTIFVSATPAPFEINLSQGKVIEQIIRPTGLPDPAIEVRPSKNQIDDLIQEVSSRAHRDERTLITTLTKRMAEELARYMKEKGIRVNYLHSEIEVIERAHVIKELRMRKIDCIVGVNLLREGIDLPEVSLVAILDADKEGFLRSATSLIQVAGRCARNINGKVLMYADQITPSMKNAIDESARRRTIQLRHNETNHITPTTIKKNIRQGIEVYFRETQKLQERIGVDEKESELREAAATLEKEMEIAAKHLQFEKAALLRDKIAELKDALDIPRTKKQEPRKKRKSSKTARLLRKKMKKHSNG